MTFNFDEANGTCKACRALAPVGIVVLDHKCAERFYSDRLNNPHGGLRYGPHTNTPISTTSRLWSLTMLAVLAIGSFALASLTAGVVVPAGVRPLNVDSRLLKVSQGDNVLNRN
jgi:hypothetical protein